MDNQAGKGSKLRKGANLKNFDEGYATINWGANHNKRKALKALERSRADRAGAKRRVEERHAKALEQALEIRQRLVKNYTSGNGQEETENEHDEILDI